MDYVINDRQHEKVFISTYSFRLVFTIEINII